MKDFIPDEAAAEMTIALQSKEIASVEVDRSGMDDFLVFHFADGTALRIRYDWIYGWEVI